MKCKYCGMDVEMFITKGPYCCTEHWEADMWKEDASELQDKIDAQDRVISEAINTLEHCVEKEQCGCCFGGIFGVRKALDTLREYKKECEDAE